jgi:hypothetical protein
VKRKDGDLHLRLKIHDPVNRDPPPWRIPPPSARGPLARCRCAAKSPRRQEEGRLCTTSGPSRRLQHVRHRGARRPRQACGLLLPPAKASKRCTPSRYAGQETNCSRRSAQHQSARTRPEPDRKRHHQLLPRLTWLVCDAPSWLPKASNFAAAFMQRCNLRSAAASAPLVHLRPSQLRTPFAHGDDLKSRLIDPLPAGKD